MGVFAERYLDLGSKPNAQNLSDLQIEVRIRTLVNTTRCG